MSKCTKDSMKVNIVYINSSKGLYVSHNPYDQFGIFETSCVPAFSNDMMYSGHCAKACAISYPGENAWKISYICCEVVRVCPGSQPWWINLRL